MQAYLWLSSERKFNAGPIPFLARMEYCDMLGLPYETAMVFAVVITHLDSAYWDYQEEREAKRAQLRETLGEDSVPDDKPHRSKPRKVSRWGR